MHLRVPRGSRAEQVVAPLRPRRRAAASRRSLERRRRRDAGGAHVPGRDPATATAGCSPAARRGYAWVNGLGARTPRRPGRGRLRLPAGRRRPGVAPRVGRLRDLPRPVRVGGAGVDAPDWAVRARLGRAARPAAARRRRTSVRRRLRGVEQHLDHIESLGANADLPHAVLPGRQPHRYDATTFDHVDPLLGGDEALASLTRARTRAACASIGDLTHEPHAATRTSGSRGAGRPDAAERDFFYFDEARRVRGLDGRHRRCRSSNWR